MEPLPPPVLYDPSTHHHLLPDFAALHTACILTDDMPATILDPVGADNQVKLSTYWEQKHQQVLSNSRLIILQFSDSSETEVSGLVMLDMPPSETGPFRSLVEKLMVSPNFRRMGVARRLMEKLESEAKVRDRGLIMLDTTIGLPAADVYSRLGYKPVGIVPKYAISPRDGKTLMDEMFFYKDLREG